VERERCCWLHRPSVTPYVHSRSGHPSKVPGASQTVARQSQRVPLQTMDSGRMGKRRARGCTRKLSRFPWAGAHAFKYKVSRNEKEQRTNETVVYMEGRSVEDGVGSWLPDAVVGEGPRGSLRFSYYNLRMDLRGRGCSLVCACIKRVRIEEEKLESELQFPSGFRYLIFLIWQQAKHT